MRIADASLRRLGIITLRCPSLQHADAGSDWFNLEVEGYQAENKRLQVLHEVVKDSEALGVG